MKIIIYCEHKHPRLLYTCDFIFRCVLGMKFTILTDQQTYNVAEGMKINYANQKTNGYYIQKHPSLLFEDGIRFFEVREFFNEMENLPFLEIENNSLDIFACIFFLISRYEEYWDFEADQHGRFTAKAALLNPSTPYVDLWVDLLRRNLNKSFPTLPPIPKPKYRFLASYDIDHVRAYLWKGFPRSLGGMMGDLAKLDFRNLKQRLSTWIQPKKDPYDQFDFLNQIHEKLGIEAIFFWLMGDYGNYDKNPNYLHPKFREQINSVSKKYEIGIHPSYTTYKNEQQLSLEISRIREISPDIKASRFHFLRYSFPDSFRGLIQLGIKHDYSMGYASCPGFRAGTSHPFLWFDLELNKVTELLVHPFQIMDVTLKNYMNLSIGEAEELANDVIQQVKEYGGCLTTLWHNSSFDEREWKGWKEMYERILEIAQEGVIPKS